MLILEFAKSQILFHALLFGRIQWYRPMLSLTWSLLVLMDITPYLMFLIPAIQRYFSFFKFLTCAFVHITFFNAFLCYFYVCILFTVPPFSYYIIFFWPNIFDLSLAQHWVSFASILVYLFLTFFNISIFFVGFKVSLQSNVCQYRFSFCWEFGPIFWSQASWFFEGKHLQAYSELPLQLWSVC